MILNSPEGCCPPPPQGCPLTNLHPNTIPGAARTELRNFGTSPFLSNLAYYKLRRALAVYWSIIFAVSLSLSAIGWDVPLSLYFIYYTQWSLTVLVCYFIMAALITRRQAYGSNVTQFVPAPPSRTPAPQASAWRPWRWLGFGAVQGERELVNISSDKRYTDAETYYFDDEAAAGGDGAVDENEVVAAAAAADGDVQEVRVRPDALLRWTWRLQNVIFPTALLITIFFWRVIYRGMVLNPAGSYTNDDLGVKFVKPDDYAGVKLGVKLFMLLHVHGELAR